MIFVESHWFTYLSYLHMYAVTQTYCMHFNPRGQNCRLAVPHPSSISDFSFLVPSLRQRLWMHSRCAKKRLLVTSSLLKYTHAVGAGDQTSNVRLLARLFTSYSASSGVME